MEPCVAAAAATSLTCLDIFLAFDIKTEARLIAHWYSCVQRVPHPLVPLVLVLQGLLATFGGVAAPSLLGCTLAAVLVSVEHQAVLSSLCSDLGTYCLHLSQLESSPPSLTLAIYVIDFCPQLTIHSQISFRCRRTSEGQMACLMVSRGPLYFAHRAVTLLSIHLSFSFCEKPARMLLELANGTSVAQ